MVDRDWLLDEELLLELLEKQAETEGRLRGGVRVLCGKLINGWETLGVVGLGDGLLDGFNELASFNLVVVVLDVCVCFFVGAAILVTKWLIPFGSTYWKRGYVAYRRNFYTL